MPTPGQFGPSLTGLFEATWRPKKAVTILWRRVETIDPDAYAAVMEWVSHRGDPSDTFHWLEAMATNEAVVDPVGALAELEHLRRADPPGPIAESAELLRDLIWEASDSNSDWLTWPPCRLCGRRWATAPLAGVILCPRHRTAPALIDLLRAEMDRYPGLLDHAALIERLRADPEAVAAEATLVADAQSNGAGPDDPRALAAERPSPPPIADVTAGDGEDERRQ